MRVTLLNFSRLAAILAVGHGALVAQGVQTGNLAGRVTNQQGAPIVGAAVRLDTGRGVRTSVTNERGEWRIPLLLVGPCTLNVTANGYIGQRANAQINLGQTNIVNFSMRETTAASATVEITGAAQEIDPTTVTDGKNITAAAIDNLPINARGVASIASLAPGMVSNSIRGAQSNHTQWMIDGVDGIDPVTGGGIMYLNEETIQEVQVVTGGATADMGRFTGGMVNVVTKSGTNKFDGTMRFEITNPDWNAIAPMGTKAESQHSTLQLYHVSGPIWKDHVFFSVGYRVVTPTVKNIRYTSAPEELGGNQQYIAYNTDERQDIKIDWQINESHRLFGLYNNTKMDRFGIDYPYSFGYDSTSPATLSAQPDEYGNISFGYVGTLSSNFVLKANYGKKNEKLGGPGGGGQGGPDVPMMIDATTYAIYDNGFFGYDSDSRPVQNATLSADWFLDSPFGQHELKIGVDWFQSQRNAANAQTPSDYIINFSGFINDPEEYGTNLDNRLFDEDSNLEHWKTFEGATTKNTIWSYYVNDKIKFNKHFSANVGVRLDKFASENDIQAMNFDITAFSPRLTGIYDLNGDGRWVFEVGYNQYAGQIMQGATDGASVVGNPALYQYDYIGGPGNLRSSYSDTPSYVYNPDLYRQSNLIDADMKPPTMTETSVLARFSDGRRGFYSLAFSQRKWRNFVASYASEQPNPIDDEDYLLTLISNDPALKRDYKGIEFQWEKQFTPEFSFGGNVTLSETKGNFEGGQTGSDGPLRLYGPLGTYEPVFEDNALAGAYQPTEEQLAPYGYLSTDRPLMVKTWTNYNKSVFGKGNLNLGVYASYTSGNPYSNSARANLRGYVDGIYGPYYTRYFSQRGAFRFNSYYNVSLQVGYDHTFWKGVKVFGHANITNIFNHQIQVDWNTTGNAYWNSGATTGYQPDNFNRPTAIFLPGANYGKPTSVTNYLSPRGILLVLGVRY
ncbi:MAG: TonB-dependent receptor [Holophagales bacterium]|jgi:outer membrane receptor for ferrienterochelin and colicin|nr:TonB-dependent receptor [Holophagales bacterium]